MRKFFQSTFPLTHSTFGLLLIAGACRWAHGICSRLGGELLKRFVSDQKDNSLTEKKCSKRQCESLLNETLFFHPRFSHCSLSPPFRSLFERNHNSTIYPSSDDMFGTSTRNWVTFANFFETKFRRRFSFQILNLLGKQETPNRLNSKVCLVGGDACWVLAGKLLGTVLNLCRFSLNKEKLSCSSEKR